MNAFTDRLQALFDRIPRRHSPDNVKELNALLDEYEDLLMEMEADSQYAEIIAPFFEPLDDIRSTVKKSNSPKASKKEKDVLFDEASGALKDSIGELLSRS